MGEIEEEYLYDLFDLREGTEKVLAQTKKGF